MITKITGKLLGVADDHVTIGIDAFEYQVHIPEFARRQLQSRVGEKVSLHTQQYLEGNPAQGRLTPRLVGFTSPVEREFFDLFCSVDGLGARKALRAMVRPVQDVAQLIESQDAKGLTTLPGIGAATADRIVAKLRRRMPRFALLITEKTASETETSRDVVQDTHQVLCNLGHSETDARKLIDAVLATKKKFKDVEAMLTAVYRQKSGE